MEERRATERLEEDKEVTITVISGGKNLPKDKIIYNYSKDLSVSGARIQANAFLPVDTLLMIEMTLKTLQQKITALGKVKWIKSLFGGDSFEAGVEFVNIPSDTTNKLADYILWKQQMGSYTTV